MVSKRLFTVGILLLPAVLGCSSSNEQSGTASQAPASPPIAAAPQIAPPPPPSAEASNQKGTPAGPSPSTAPTPTAIPSPTSVPPDRRTLPEGPLPATLVWYEKGERFERKVEIGRRQAIVLKESLQSREPAPSRVVIESSRGGAPTTRTNPDAEMGSVEFIDPASGDKMFRTVYINFPDRVSWNSSSIYGPNDPLTVEDEVREPGEPIDMEVPLPGRATDVVVGAGGRYLIISMHASRQAAVFDVRAGAVKQVLTMPTDDFVIAAGATRFVVVDRAQGKLTRYDFATLEPEREVKPDLQLAGVEAALNPATEGPLWLVQEIQRDDAEVVHPFDLESLEPLSPARDPSTQISNDAKIRTAPAVTVGADGHSLCVSFATTGAWRFQLADGTLSAEEVKHSHSTHLTMLADGRHMLTGNKIVTPPKSEAPLHTWETVTHSTPIVGAAGWFTVRYGCNTWRGYSVPLTLELAFHRELNLNPEAVLRLDGLGDEAKWDSQVPLGSRFMARRMQYLAIENTFAYVTRHPDRVVLKRFELDQASEQQERTRPEITSRAPTQFRRGQPLAYQIEAKSATGELKYALSTGPSGMKISKTGLVEWVGPEIFQEYRAVVRVTNAAGRTTFHELVLTSDEPSKISTPESPAGNLPFPPEKLIEVTAGGPQGDGRTAAGPASQFRRKTTVITLPGTFDDICLGGGGKYLITYHEIQQRLLVTDVARRAIVRYLPVSGPDVLFAAGRKKLVVAHGSNGAAASYDLETGALVNTTTFKSPIEVMRIGCDSPGPLLVGRTFQGRHSARLYDLATLESFGASTYSAGTHVRASADGSTFAYWTPNTSPSSVGLIQVRGKRVTMPPKLDGDMWPAIPGADGLRLHTRDGIRAVVGNEPIGAAPSSEPAPSTEPDRGLTFHLPAASGRLYLRLSAERDSGTPRTKPPTLSLYTEGHPRPLRVLDDVAEVPLPTKDPNSRGTTYQIDKQVFLLPAARAVVTTPATKHELLIQDFDVDAELANSTENLVFVDSVPPGFVVEGEKLVYQIEAKSRQKPVEYRLANGPAGLTVSSSGLVEWEAHTANGDTAEVAVTVRAGDQTVEYAFNVLVTPARSSSAAPSGRSPSTASADAPPASRTTPATNKPGGSPSATKPVAATPAASTPPAEMRTWSSADGKFTTEATMSGVLNGKVILKTADGKRLDIALEQLTPADQEIVKKRYPQLK